MAFELFGMFRGKRETAKPAKLQGSAGFVVTGGYIQSNETNPSLQGKHRWRTAADILSNISIVAASTRYMLNLIARPNWRFEPADKSAEAKQLAEFAEDIISDIQGSWTSTVRRMALYRYHGFGLHEWQAKQRDDGRIGIDRIAVRPCHTIDRWDIEETGDIKGVMQTRPVDGKEIYLPRGKTIYLVDDSLTDSPEGMGWFRHLVEPTNRLQNLLRIETMGFERDLNGIPVGRAPISEINLMVGQAMPNGELYTQAMADSAIQGIKNFVRMEAKKPGTGLLLDSQPHSTTGSDGEELTTVPMWDMDLLTSDPKGMDAMAKAINRLEFEMALVMGTESMLVGREGEGSRALSEDKSRNLYLQAESTLEDMCEVIDRDLIGPVWAMNGLPEELKPRAQTEGVSFKDAEKVARVLRDMATAGAVLAPDDPAVNDLRDALDIPHAPELTDEERGILMGTKPDPNAPMLGEEELDGDEPPPKPQGQGQAQKYDPNQPRDRVGRWTDTGAADDEGGQGVVALTPEIKRAELIEPNNGKTLEELREGAVENQKELDRMGKAIERDLGIDYAPPPPGFEVKTVESLNRKITEEGYAGAHEITDISRATFVLDSPQQADQVIEALSRERKVYDKNWQHLDRYGYLDRKIYVQHPDGGVSEIQLVPRGVQQLKMGQGHQLYEIARRKSTPIAAANAAARKSRTLYHRVLRDMGFDDILEGK